MGERRRIEWGGIGAATFLSPPMRFIVGDLVPQTGMSVLMLPEPAAGLAPRRLAGRDCARRLRHRWRECSAGLRPPRVVVSGLAARPPARRPARRAGVRLAAQRGGFPPPPAGRNPDGFRTAAQQGGANPPPGRVCPRRRADGSTYYRLRAGGTCRRRAGASTYQLVYLAIGDASSMISTSSRESFSKARHMATSSQESQGPCSSPVASSTTVKRGG